MRLRWLFIGLVGVAAVVGGAQLYLSSVRDLSPTENPSAFMNEFAIVIFAAALITVGAWITIRIITPSGTAYQ